MGKERENVKDLKETRFYPLARQYPFRLKTYGIYHTHSGWPVGAVVHYTAGVQGDAADAKSNLLYAKQKNYCYLVIDKDGLVHQAAPLNEWGSHCGTSEWPGLKGDHLSNQLVGIEIMCPGLLEKKDEKFQTWYGQVARRDQIRVVAGRPDIADGAYWKYTDAQETALINLLLWMSKTIPYFSLKNVLGHHEISPLRKSDPGGSLSMPMPDFREHLYQIESLKTYKSFINV